MFKKDTIYILKNIFSIISSPLVVWQSSKWVTLAEETCEWKVTLGWLVAMTHREGVMLKGWGGRCEDEDGGWVSGMNGWGAGGESGTRSGKSESYGSHHHLKTLENTWRWLVCVGADEDALRVERTRLFFFFFFPPPSPSPGASQQSRVVSKRGPGEPSECGHQTQSWVSTGKCNFKQWISALWLNSCCFPLGTYHFSSGWRVICCPWCGIISLLLTSGDFCWKKENLCGM